MDLCRDCSTQSLCTIKSECGASVRNSRELAEQMARGFAAPPKKPEPVATPAPEAPAFDEIAQPRHYTQGIECWDYITSHRLGFLAGNVIKYVTRHEHKGEPVKDLLKARAYLDRMLKELGHT